MERTEARLWLAGGMALLTVPILAWVLYGDKLQPWLKKWAGLPHLTQVQTVDAVVEPPADRQGWLGQTACELARQAIRPYDPAPQLILISTATVHPSGRSPRWEFSFRLPRQWAHAAVCLAWDEEARTARLEATITPYPKPDSLMSRMQSEGRVRFGFLWMQWRRECRKPSLPLAFKDSDRAMAELAAAGLDPGEEFTLSAGGSQPEVWVAATRSRSLTTRIH